MNDIIKLLQTKTLRWPFKYFIIHYLKKQTKNNPNLGWYTINDGIILMFLLTIHTFNSFL